MIEQLFQLVQQESQTEIINNPAIPNEHNNQAVGLATSSIFKGLQGALANGGLKDVIGMFGGQASTDTNNPMVGGIVNNLVEGLMNKFGIDSPMAKSIAASLIPSIMGKLVHRTNDPSDTGFDINNIIGALTGGNASSAGVQIPNGQNVPASGGGIDFGSIVKSLSSGGLDANHDGSIGLDDLSGLIGGAAANAQQQHQGEQQPQGGGIFDMLKGLMGN
jgi:hypothetical protein